MIACMQSSEMRPDWLQRKEGRAARQACEMVVSAREHESGRIIQGSHNFFKSLSTY